MDRFNAALGRLAAIPDHACGDAWQWPAHTGRELKVRDGLYRVVEAELDRGGRLEPASRAQAAGRQAQVAWGDLRGLLAGLPDGLLDQPPAAGEWSLRQVLTHVLLNERRYRSHVQHALRRQPHEPVYVESEAAVNAAESAAGMTTWIDQIDRQRRRAIEFLDLEDSALGRPTIWNGHDVDVGFRLTRFAGHIVEHTIQIEKALAALGVTAGEAARIGRRISAARAAHELLSPAAELAGLDAALEALAGPEPGHDS